MEGPLGGLLEARRRALGLSLRHVARTAGISPSYLVALEQGRNPTTGRPPMPSPRVLAALGRTLGIGRSALLELAAPPQGSPHMLLYQKVAGARAAAEAARLVFGDDVDEWIDVPDPDAYGRRPYGPDRALAALEAHLAGRRRAADKPRIGLIFGARSKERRGDDLITVLEREATWETDVADLCRRALGVDPAANVCVYRAAEIERRDRPPDPLASALKLIRAHPVVAVQSSDRPVLTGPPAIEAVLAGVAPAGTERDTWRAVARAAAAGLAGEQP